MMRKGRWQTKAEKRVGKMLEKIGFTVVYQHKLGPYILDIFLPEIQTNIEVHGPHHVISSRILKDQARSRYIKEKGYKQYIIKAQDTAVQGTLKDFVNKVIDDNKMNTYRKSIFNNTLSVQLKSYFNKLERSC